MSRARTRAARLGIATALLLAAGAGRAQGTVFTRTTTCDPPDPSAGQALWWAGSPPTVTWWLYTGNVPPGCGDLATLESLTAASFSAWSQRVSPATGATSGFSFAHTSANQTSDPTFGVAGRNLVTWRKGLCSAIPTSDSCHTTRTCQDKHNCWDETGTLGPDVLALTWVSFNPSTGQIGHADMELNEWNGGTSATTSAGYSYTCSAPGAAACGCTATDADRGGCTSASTACTWADVGSIVTHEAGHVLGLDHPCQTCSVTMSALIGLGTLSKRVLSTGDLNGVCAIYPGTGAATPQNLGACPNGSGSTVVRSTQSCGCGGDPSAALWALLGPLLLLRRRGRRPHPHGPSVSRSTPEG